MWAVVPPSPLLDVANVRATHKRPVYQLHIIQCGTIIACALQRVQVTESNCSVSTARMSTELLLNMRIIVFFLLLVYCNSYLQCCDTVGCHVTPRCFTPDVLPATTFPFLAFGRTASPAQLLWPTGFLCGWSVGLEFLAGQLA